MARIGNNQCLQTIAFYWFRQQLSPESKAAAKEVKFSTGLSSMVGLSRKNSSRASPKAPLAQAPGSREVRLCSSGASRDTVGGSDSVAGRE